MQYFRIEVSLKTQFLPQVDLEQDIQVLVYLVKNMLKILSLVLTCQK